MNRRYDSRKTHVCLDRHGEPRLTGDGMGTLVTPDAVTCGRCHRSWCDRCDGTHGPLCHWCAGRGYSVAPIGRRQLRELAS